MTNLDTEPTKPKRSKKLIKYPHGKPRNIQTVLDIIYLRDKQRWTWEEISQVMNMSRMGALLLHKRWHDWAYSSGALKHDDRTWQI